MLNKKNIILAIMIGTIFFYWKDYNKITKVIKNEKTNSDFYQVYRINNCEMEKKEYLCRIDLKSPSRLISVGLKERYINFIKNKKIKIETYFESERECLKSVSYESFKEEMTYCIPVFSQKN